MSVNTLQVFDKITKKELQTKGVRSLPDRPNAYSRYGEGAMSATQLKETFDALSDLLAGRINEIFSLLESGKFLDYVNPGSRAKSYFRAENLGILLDDMTTGDFCKRVRIWHNGNIITLEEKFNKIQVSNEGKFASSVKCESSGGGYVIKLLSSDGDVLSQFDMKVSSESFDEDAKGFIVEKISDAHRNLTVPYAEEVYSRSKRYADEGDLSLSERIDEVSRETVASIGYDAKTGVLSFTSLGGGVKSIDLPLELTVSGGYYSHEGKEIVLSLTSGGEIRIPVGELLSDLITLPTVGDTDREKIPVTTSTGEYGLRRMKNAEFISDGLGYKLQDGTYFISAGDCNDSEVTIPKDCLGVAVTGIENGGFEGKKGIISVSFPDSLLDIGTGAFRSCVNLTKLTLPSGVGRIKSKTFFGCTGLCDIYITYEGGIISLDSIDAFDGTSAKIHVPLRLLSEYRSATNWNFISSRIVGEVTVLSVFDELINDGYYDSASKSVYLGKRNGDRLRIGIGELFYDVSGMPAVSAGDGGKIPVVDENLKYSVRRPVGLEYYSEGLEFEFNGVGYTLTSLGSCTDTDVIIPESHGGLPVTRISSLSGSISSIRLPSCVSSISGDVLKSDFTKKVICYAITPPVLESAPDGEGVADIYVSAEAISDYVIATNWNLLLSHLFEIETVDTVSRSLSAINNANAELERAFSEHCRTAGDKINALTEKSSVFDTQITECKSNVSNLFGVVGNLQTIDTQLSQAIQNEQNERAKKDAVLSTKINDANTEISSLTAGMSNLNVAIGNLSAIDSALSSAIASEQSKRSEQYGLLSEQIEKINSKLDGFIDVSEVGA